MKIRKLTKEDYAVVLPLYEELDRIHYETRPDYFGKRECFFPEDAYLQTLSSEDSLMLGAFAEDRLLGMAGASLYHKSGMIQGIKTVCLDNIFVLPQARGMGIGKKLFAQVENWAREKGAVRLDLHVWDFNQDAQKLYRAMGMQYQYHVMEKKL